MNSGYYSPAFRMLNGHVERIEAITENLANCNTPGFRKLNVSHRIFETLFNDAKGKVGTWKEGEHVDPVAVDFTAGSLRPTQRPLDFALTGKGFFTVDQDGRELYTRKGDFKIDTNGLLINADGMPVKGTGGNITFPPNTMLSDVNIEENGTIRLGTQTLGQLRVVSFEKPDLLQRAGTTLYAAPEGVQPDDAGKESRVLNGTLESSNTTIFEEMADLIACMRNFEACQKMVRENDDSTGKMIQQIG